jgi:hypothetical protein
MEAGKDKSERIRGEFNQQKIVIPELMLQVSTRGKFEVCLVRSKSEMGKKLNFRDSSVCQSVHTSTYSG